MAVNKVKYAKECINRTDCDPDETLSATYDYVGAVYGESDSAKYDGVLTAEERKAVEEKFGRLTNPDYSVEYVSKARNDFLNRHSSGITIDACNSPEIIGFYSTPQDKDNRGVAAFGGHHLCGKTYGTAYMQTGYELSVAADPSKWVFLIEDYESIISISTNYMGKNLEEYALFSSIVSALQIPVLSPIKYDVFSEKVSTELENKYNITREELAVYIMFDMFEGIAQQTPPQDGEQFYQVWSSCAFFVATEMGMDPEDLMDYALAFKAEPHRDDEYESYSARLNLIDRMSYGLQKSIEVVNEINAHEAIKTLEPYRGKIPIFIMGRTHLPIARAVNNSL